MTIISSSRFRYWSFHFILDLQASVHFFSGSADLFLPGTSCQTCQGHRLYDTNTSSTYRPLGRNFSLGYGDGSTVQGCQVTDTVTISGLTARVVLEPLYRLE